MGQLRISPGLETLLAPALLPRGTLNQQLLLALKEVGGAAAATGLHRGIRSAAATSLCGGGTRQRASAAACAPAVCVCVCVSVHLHSLQFKLSFAFRSAQQVVQGAGAAASYLLTFLDDDMLIGRGPQGSFIFSRAADGDARDQAGRGGFTYR